ncbi:uncharacterized protein LOC121177238 isoform X2 [Toxotes jaculatrix]|uniref:uncharacterized protein LOC121177238 isoform X2 n=1 Tax=Toxotes jaculatrix TaxID=941984 RepID=UPI001B3AE88B|nr:uncharacterized protein LOC121177238 isoform X2 [Toxotes jaculatrix]
MMPLFIFLVLLCEICQVAGDVKKTSGIMQDTGVITAAVGDNVTLRCVAQDEVVTFLSWYQQRLGDKPQLISTRMKHKTVADVFPPYKERFHASSQSQSNNHLTITNVRLEDSATYYCGILEFSAIEFGQGVFLHVKTPQSNIQAVVHQSDLEPLRSGDSLKLNCTVFIESPCAGEQNLYWYRHGASQPAVMDPSAGQCTSVSNKKPHMKHCALSLAIKSVSASDAGMYYCALRSCGEIVFGNGTRVDVGRRVCESPPSPGALLEGGIGRFHYHAACFGFHHVQVEKDAVLCL